MSRTLTHAEAVGITGTEPSLTDADKQYAVRRAYSSWRTQFALDGDPRARTPDWGCADDRLSAMADNRGIWTRITDTTTGTHRAGHIPWATAEAILRSDRNGEQDTLFDLEANT